MALLGPSEAGWLALLRAVLASPQSWPYLLLGGLMVSQHLLLLAFMARLETLGLRIDQLSQAIHELGRVAR
jgi:hypothetical protein